MVPIAYVTRFVVFEIIAIALISWWLISEYFSDELGLSIFLTAAIGVGIIYLTPGLVGVMFRDLELAHLNPRFYYD